MHDDDDDKTMNSGFIEQRLVPLTQFAETKVTKADLPLQKLRGQLQKQYML